MATKLTAAEKKARQERRTRATEWRRLRQRNFLTQNDLAKLLGISPYSVSIYENGRAVPHAGTQAKFAALKAKYDKEY